MFDHYVMFRLKPDRKGELNTFVAKLKQLQHDVPVIRSSEVMINGPKSRFSFDLMFHARFDDEAGFKAYMAHPKHVPVVKYVEEVSEAIADLDVPGTK